MQIGPLMQAVFFLADTIFTLYILAILLRIMLQWVRADFYNPFCQFIIKLTNPVFIPVRRLVPGYGGIDWAGIIVLFVFAFLKQAILIFIQMKVLTNGVGLLLLATSDILRQIFYIYVFATLALVIASWISPTTRNPMLKIVYQLIMAPLNLIRKYIPLIAGFDLSPLIFMIILVLINILVIQWIAGMGFAIILNQ